MSNIRYRSFKEWIKQFEGAQTAIGDLARDIARDTAFPRKRGLTDLTEYMHDMGASTQALAVLRAAHMEYAAQRQQAKESDQRLTRRPEEVAVTLGIGRNMIYELIKTGAIRSIKAGRKVLIPVTAIEEFLGASAKPAPAAPPAPSEPRPFRVRAGAVR